MKTRNYRLDEEHEEQKKLMQWADTQKQKYPQLRALYAIPNGGHRHISIAVRMKAEGVKPGVPDLCLAYPSNGFHGLYIEMKRRKGGVVSDKQQEWRDRLTANGYAVHVCAGWEVARDTIIQYLTPKTQN